MIYQTTTQDANARDAQLAAKPTPSSLGGAPRESDDQNALMRALLVHGIAGAMEGLKTARE
jgi:hypothetical protein